MLNFNNDIEEMQFSTTDLFNCLPEIQELHDLDVCLLKRETEKKGEVRAAWASKGEARCNFKFKRRITRRGDIIFFSIWQKSITGRTLTDIKSDDKMIAFFAEEMTKNIIEVLGENLKDCNWCIITTPKRRHLTHNFATEISKLMAQSLEIPFYEDVASAKTKHRVGAEFTLNVLPREENIIVFDDFVTTGSTMNSMYRLLKDHHKTLFFAAGINNKLD